MENMTMDDRVGGTSDLLKLYGDIFKSKHVLKRYLNSSFANGLSATYYKETKSGRYVFFLDNVELWMTEFKRQLEAIGRDLDHPSATDFRIDITKVRWAHPDGEGFTEPMTWEEYQKDYDWIHLDWFHQKFSLNLHFQAG